MIEGTQHFRFLAVSAQGHAVMFLFDEGMLVIDKSLPGWGVMPHAALLRLFPEYGEPSPRDHADGNDPADPSNSIDWSLSSDTESTDSSSRSSSHSRDDSAASDDESESDSDSGPLWVPPDSWLGWWPNQGPLKAARVTGAAVQAYEDARANPALMKAVLENFRAGHLNQVATNTAPAGVMVELRQFGSPRLLAWRGPWQPAGSPVLAERGFTTERIAALLAQAKLSDNCNLAEVQEIDNSEYQGHVEDVKSRVLVFANGLLVVRHPDGSLVGWHAKGPNRQWCRSMPDMGDMLADLCEQQADAQGQAMVRAFQLGALHDPDGPRFVALTQAERRHQWMCIQVEAGTGLIRPGTAGALTEAEVQQARRDARVARIHDWQTVHDHYGLGCGAWNVPVLLGAMRCVLGVLPERSLLKGTWHATLLPLVEQLLTAHKADEMKWLADGVICQPIDDLIELARRDKRLRRPEVAVMWPASALEGLFKAIAPKAAVRVTQLPKLEEVEKALTGKAGRLLVFKAVRRPTQSVAVAMFDQCWSHEDWHDVDTLRERVCRAFESGAIERLVAMATID